MLDEAVGDWVRNRLDTEVLAACREAGAPAAVVFTVPRHYGGRAVRGHRRHRDRATTRISGRCGWRTLRSGSPRPRRTSAGPVRTSARTTSRSTTASASARTSWPSFAPRAWCEWAAWPPGWTDAVGRGLRRDGAAAEQLGSVGAARRTRDGSTCSPRPRRPQQRRRSRRASASLSVGPSRSMPGPDNPQPMLHLMKNSGDAAASIGGSHASDWLGLAFHGFAVTHLDAHSHQFFNGRMYNDRPAELVSTRAGATNGSVRALRARAGRPRRASRRASRGATGLARTRRRTWTGGSRCDCRRTGHRAAPGRHGAGPLRSRCAGRGAWCHRTADRRIARPDLGVPCLAEGT